MTTVAPKSRPGKGAPPDLWITVDKTGPVPDVPTPIGEVVAHLQQRIDALPPDLAHRRTFIETYQRTTRAIGAAVQTGYFEDTGWVERWTVAFADLFLIAHDHDRLAAGGHSAPPVPRPWRLAFAAAEELPILAHLLLGMNAHINYDLPQALLQVIDEHDFADPALLARRRRDHERIDAIIATRIAAEDREIGGSRTVRDRLLTPVNRLSSRRFLRESRQKVWLNVSALHDARVTGPAAYTTRLAELEVLAAARVADLLAPGSTLVKLAAAGFGVTLPPP